MAIRQFSFINGPETSTLPTYTSPSASTDLISKGYLEDYGFTTDTIVKGVADAAAVKAIAAADRSDKQLIYCRATNRVYSFNSGSSATGNDVSVIAPTAGTGRWLSIAGGGGGGGSSLQWHVGSSDSAPDYAVYNDAFVYNFSVGFGQYLFAEYKVPESYSTGESITVHVPIGINSSTATNNVKFQITATLIRLGTDAITSTTNQAVITEQKAVLGTADVPQKFEFIITSNGQINSTAIDKHLIKMKLERIAATSNDDSADAWVVVDGCSIKVGD